MSLASRIGTSFLGTIGNATVSSRGGGDLTKREAATRDEPVSAPSLTIIILLI
jgi:hypothetical protein